MPVRHVLLAVLVTLVWGANFVVIEIGLADVPPLLLLAVRFTLVVVPAIFFLPRPRIPVRRLLAIGATMSLGQFALLYLGIAAGMPPGLASLLLQVQVFATVLIAAVALRERPGRRQWVGIGIGAAGVAVIVAQRWSGPGWLSLVLVLGAALSWAVGNVAARGVPGGGLPLTVWTGVVVPLPAFALSLLVDGPAAVGHALAHPTAAAIGSTLYTVLFASLLGYGVWNTLLARYPAAKVVPFALLVPVWGVATAWLVFGETPTAAEAVGALVMLAGLATATLGGRRVRPTAATPQPVGTA